MASRMRFAMSPGRRGVPASATAQPLPQESVPQRCPAPLDLFVFQPARSASLIALRMSLSGWRSLLVLLIGFTAIGTVGWLAAGQLVEITRQLPGYKANIHKKLESIRGNKDGDFTKAASTIGELNKELTKAPETPSIPPPAPATVAPPRRQSPSKAPAADAPGSPDHPLTVSVAEPSLNIVQQVEALLGSLLGPFETTGVVVIFTLFMLA